MKKFVISTNSCNLTLTDAHIEWLRTNGHPDADWTFGRDDRSNPDLIACIEAVRASKQQDADEVKRLHDAYVKLRADNDAAYVELSEQIDKLLAMLDYRPYLKHRIIAEMRKAIDSGDWCDVTIYAGPKSGISKQSVKEQFIAVTKTELMHEPQFNAVEAARKARDSYCEEHSMWIDHRGEVKIEDGFEIKSYDETRFTASAVGHYAERSYESDYEFMELKPFIDRATLATFVDTGDTDGLMDYLKNLNVGGFMDIRDDRPKVETRPTRAITLAEQAEFEALLAQIS